MNTETDNKKPTEGRSLPPCRHLGLYEVVLQWTGNICGMETERKEKHYVFAESRLDAVALIPEDTFEKAKTFKINRLCCLDQIIQKPIER